MKIPFVSAWLALLAGPGLFAQTPAPAPDYVAAPVVQWPAGAGGNDHYYQAVALPNGLIWEDAQQLAADHAGYLATVSSSKENDFVFGLIDFPDYWTVSGDGRYSVGPWLGGYQLPGSPEPAGGWEWVHAEGPFTYTHWGRTQPDNSGNEDRLGYLIYGVGQRANTWNDEPANSRPHGIVVEYDTKPASPLSVKPFRLNLESETTAFSTARRAAPPSRPLSLSDPAPFASASPPPVSPPPPSASKTFWVVLATFAVFALVSLLLIFLIPKEDRRHSGQS